MGERIAHLRDPGAVEVEALVVRLGVLVVGADDVAPGSVPEGAGDVVLQPVVGPERRVHRRPERPERTDAPAGDHAVVPGGAERSVSFIEAVVDGSEQQEWRQDRR
jgi:hypothetical protein